MRTASYALKQSNSCRTRWQRSKKHKADSIITNHDQHVTIGSVILKRHTLIEHKNMRLNGSQRIQHSTGPRHCRGSKTKRLVSSTHRRVSVRVVVRTAPCCPGTLSHGALHDSHGHPQSSIGSLWLDRLKRLRNSSHHKTCDQLDR